MDFDFPHYLLSKQTVDDRALNRGVLEALASGLPIAPLRIIEVGAGVGTMAARLVRWGLLKRAEYIAVDEMAQNIEYARTWTPEWAKAEGLSAAEDTPYHFRLRDSTRDLRLTFEHADVFDFIEKPSAPADILIAHAFLDLLPMPESISKLLALTNGLAWLTVNFDGVTSLEPAVDPALDELIERLYHETMDARPTGGDSRSGRHLFDHLRRSGAQILAAGASDWVVFARDGKYPADEAYFLQCIMHFVAEALRRQPGLEGPAFAEWLAARRAQIQRGQLVYIAHQIDFLVKPAA